jgi:rhamnulokinase
MYPSLQNNILNHWNHGYIAFLNSFNHPMSRSSGDFSCIAVDMGASSIRVMLGTLDSGYLTVEEVHRIPNGTIFRDRHERWDMDRILTEIVHGIGWAWKLSGGSAVSVGVDSWGVDFTLLDREGKPLEMPVAYRDQRTEGMRSEWSSIMPEMETFSRTGINFYPFNTLFQLLSIRGSEILSRSSSLLFLPCYINYLLTGKAINELTIASTSQMLKVDSVRWDPEIVGKLGLTEELLGKVTSPGTRLGKVVLPELKETMLEVVAVCAHDTACVVASIPALEHGSVYISTGTWCIVGIENDLPLISEEAFRNGFTS